MFVRLSLSPEVVTAWGGGRAFLGGINRFDAVSAYMRKMDHYGLSDF